MKVRRTILLTVALVALLSGCDRSGARNAFVESGEIRLQVGRVVQFRYDPLKCQMSFNRDRKEFRIQTDNVSDFYAVRLSEIPVSEGQTLSADLSWTTATDVLNRKNLALRVVKTEGEKIWLWSDSGRIGLSVVILE